MIQRTSRIPPVAEIGGTAAKLEARLRAMRRSAGEFDASRYFRGDRPFEFLNVGTPAIRSLARAWAREHLPGWPHATVRQLTERLLSREVFECKQLGVEILARDGARFTPTLLSQAKRWLAAGLAANWATTDLLCGTVLGAMVAKQPALAARLLPWSDHRGLWVRRASAVALLPAIRRGAGESVEIGYEIADRLLDDPHDLIHKANGWMLRELGKRDAGRLERWLLARGSRVPRTTVRYAIERVADADRRRLLIATALPPARSGRRH